MYVPGCCDAPVPEGSQERERETLVFPSAQVSNHRRQDVGLRQQSVAQRVLVGHTLCVECIFVQTQFFQVISHNLG